MPAIIKSAPKIKLFVPAGETKESVVAKREAKLSVPIEIRQPEKRLWKLSVQAGSTKFTIIVEMLVLLLFLVTAVFAIVAGFAELSHLFDSDAVGHLAERAMSVQM